ncbi:LmeA family phospholipid-binding protein [Myxosarcina sp. GI1(2024)]
MDMLGTENLGEQAFNKFAELALSSQLEDCERLEVKVKTAPEKLATGELESLLIEGEGLVIETDLRVQVLKIGMKAIAVEPLKALTGNIELTQPTEGTAHLVLTETDLNCALNSPDLRAKIDVLDTYLSTAKSKLTVPQKRCQLRKNGTVAVEALVELQPSGETKEVAFTTTPKIASGGRSVVLEDIQYESGKEVSEDLTQAFLDKASKMLDLRNFEKQGLALRIQHLNVEAGRITLSAAADITEFPTL